MMKRMAQVNIKNPLSLWEKKGVVSFLLSPMGYLYGWGMAIRNRLYDVGILRVHKFPLPVISVGNLTVGGTGKTPLTIEIARGLLQRNPDLNIGLLSRGYKRRSKRGWVVSDGQRILMSVEEAGDEPMLMAHSLPGVKVIVGADRVAIVRKALARFNLNLLILDDAFQHRRIHRDVDILVIDGERGFGNGKVLPAGPLRETVENARRATCIVVTHLEEGKTAGLLPDLPSGKPVFGARLVVSRVMEGNAEREVPLFSLKGRRVWAVCGIAHPDSFLETLERLGMEISGLSSFPDHYRYTSQDFGRISDKLEKDTAVVTTEKDWVKWRGVHPFREVYVVCVRMEFLNEDVYDFLEKFVYNKTNEK